MKSRIYKITFLFLLTAIIFSSCNYNEKRQKKENEKFEISFLLYHIVDGYMNTYNKSPETVADLIIFIESTGLHTENYSKPYKFLKKKRKLIFETLPDSTFRLFERKKTLKTMVLEISFEGPCGRELSVSRFFNTEGYWLPSEWLEEEVKIIERRIGTVYRNDILENETSDWDNPRFPRTVLEYTPGILKDLCSGEVLDITGESFYRDFYYSLDSLATSNHLSRIMVPSYIYKYTE